jgi:predicted Zn-dependent peptidase
MMVLNTVLGGYFGSRLMSKIREEKGYTYGIGSALVSLRNAGYFFISTEVASGACSEAINDIHGEIRKLREELISDAELNRVRSYMLGDILRQFDGPFASADNLRYLLDLGLDYGFYDKIIHTIRNVTPDDLNVLANKYFQEDSFTEVIAGRNN